jgi:hypothetical protein
MNAMTSRDRIDPTPETLAKLRADAVLKLYESGRLNREQVQAAEDIREVWASFSRAMYPARVFDGTQDCKVVGRVVSSPLDRMTAREYRVWRTIYRPWADDQARRSHGSGQVTRLSIVTKLVVENWGPRQLEARHRLRHGTVVPILQEALSRYGEFAGWIMEKRPA